MRDALVKRLGLEGMEAAEGEVLRTIDPVNVGQVRGALARAVLPAPRISSGEPAPLLPQPSAAKKPRLDPKEIARERARAKAAEKKEEEAKKLAKGNKSIMSFFAKKQ